MLHNLNKIRLGILGSDRGAKEYSVWSADTMDVEEQLLMLVGDPRDRIDNFSNPGSAKFKEGIFLLNKDPKNLYVVKQIKPASEADNDRGGTYYGSYFEFIGGTPTDSHLFTLPLSIIEKTTKWFENNGIQVNPKGRNHYSKAIDRVYSDLSQYASIIEGSEKGLKLLESLNASIKPVDINLYRREMSRNTTAIIQVSVSHDEAGFPVMDKQELDRAFSVIFKTHALDVYEQIIIASSEFTPNMVRLSQNTPEHIKVFKLKEFEMEMMEFWIEQTTYHIRGINAATNHIQSQKTNHKTEVEQLQQQREAEKQQLQAEIEQRNSQLTNAATQFNELKEKAKDAIDDLQAQLASKEAELDNRQAEISGLKAEIVSKDELLKSVQQEFENSKHLSIKNVDNERLKELKQALEPIYKKDGAFTLISVNENLSAIDFVNQEEVNREVRKQVDSQVNNEIVRNRAQAAYEIIKSLNDTYLNLNAINRLSPAKLEGIINTITTSDLWKKLTTDIQTKFVSEYEVFRGIVAQNTHIPEDEMDSEEELEFVGDERPTRAGKGKKSGSKLMLIAIALMSLFAIAGVGAGAWMYLKAPGTPSTPTNINPPAPEANVTATSTETPGEKSQGKSNPESSTSKQPTVLTEEQINQALTELETKVKELIQGKYNAPTISGNKPASCEISYKITDNTITITNTNIKNVTVCTEGKKAIESVSKEWQTNSNLIDLTTQPEVVIEKLQTHEFKITFKKK